MGVKWAIFTGTNSTTTIKTALGLEDDVEAEDGFKILAPAGRLLGPSNSAHGEVTFDHDWTDGRAHEASMDPISNCGTVMPAYIPEITFRKKVDFKLPLNWLSRLSTT